MCQLSRRRFLETTLLSGTALALPPKRLAAAAEAAKTSVADVAGTTRLSEHLLVYHGPINVGIVRDGGKALLIDCGDGSVAGPCPGLGITAVEQLLFTHHHRDQACGAGDLADRGAKIGVPEAERDYFANPAGYWNDDRHLWRVYRNFRPHPLMLTEPLRVDEALGRRPRD